MATRENRLHLLIGLGDEESEDDGDARTHPAVHLRLVGAPPSTWCRLRACWRRRRARRVRGPVEYPSVEVWRSLATGRWR